jgi:thiol-disulfide isomerase/thioredoxin
VADEVGKRTIWFMGRECPHCKQTRPVVERLMADTGVEITELEVWHNEENAHLMRRYGETISRACGGDLGVPAFYNERTGKAICGRTSYDNLKKWALE